MATAISAVPARQTAVQAARASSLELAKLVNELDVAQVAIHGRGVINLERFVEITKILSVGHWPDPSKSVVSGMFLDPNLWVAAATAGQIVDRMRQWPHAQAIKGALDRADRNVGEVVDALQRADKAYQAIKAARHARRFGTPATPSPYDGLIRLVDAAIAAQAKAS